MKGEKPATAASKTAIAAFKQNIRNLIAANPALVSTPDAASSLVRSSASLLMLYPGLRESDLRDLADIIAAAAPEGIRAQIRSQMADIAAGKGPSAQGKALAEVRRPPQPAPAPRTASAQKTDTQAETEEEPERPDAGKRGIGLGTYRLIPLLDMVGYYDDNIFATRNDRVSDFISVLSPTLLLKSDWRKHELDASVGADLSRHADYTSENTTNYNASMDWRYDFTKRVNVYGGGSILQSHEKRESPDDVNGTRPTRYTLERLYGGTSGRFGRWAARVAGAAEWMTFSDVPTVDGVISNQDRDRTVYRGGVRLGYEVSPRLEAFIQPAVDIRRYRAQTDDFGFDRESDGFRALAGLRLNLPRRLRGEIFGGYMEQDYVDPLPDVGALAFGGRININAAAGTDISVFADRTVEETTLVGASSYLYSVVGFSLDQQVGTRIIADLDVSYAVDDFRGIDRMDRLVDAGAGIRYFLHPNYFVGADYTYRHVHSDVAEESYINNRVFVRLGAEFSPHVGPGRRAAPATGTEHVEDPFSGFFAGIGAGVSMPHSRVSGPRGPATGTGIVSADFGQAGPRWGLLLGFGQLYGPWYVGLDLKLDMSAADWQFSRTQDGYDRTILVNKSYSYGGGLRLGYRAGESVLLFGRAGFVETEFITQYDTPEDILDSDDSKRGFQLGGGVEVPLVYPLFARVSYDHTSYSSYQIDYGSGVDTFSNSEDSLDLTFGYRF